MNSLSSVLEKSEWDMIKRKLLVILICFVVDLKQFSQRAEKPVEPQYVRYYVPSLTPDGVDFIICSFGEICTSWVTGSLQSSWPCPKLLASWQWLKPIFPHAKKQTRCSRKSLWVGDGFVATLTTPKPKAEKNQPTYWYQVTHRYIPVAGSHMSPLFCLSFPRLL